MPERLRYRPRMYRLALVLGVIALGGCGTTEDDRPATLEYITTTILAPACANAQCHSAFKNESGYEFDTVEHAKAELEFLVVPGDRNASFLYEVITRDPAGDLPRMPYDQPLPDPEIELIGRWIDEGAVGLQ
ncbi:MAG TPA: c-type cytochrome domain-containing protein [Kofleriaceae bacterium]|nr:c-type cytochrome domain-containing protein [Kofleriaceae bacterium]